ncbi:MAG: alpha/beta hydrolase [Geodermatophilaceae bacterium]|nr:alpha/beta hydrolase [Geodermatophilaceae bacterium]
MDDEARSRHPSYTHSSLHAVDQMRLLTREVKRRLPQITAPLLVMHARRDSVIPPDNAPWIYANASSEHKELLWLENSDHIITEDHDHPLVTRAAVAWIRQAA